MESSGSLEAFAEQLREALANLHDYVRLQHCPLCTLFFPDPSLAGPSRAQRLRRLLLETIEELSPPDRVPLDSREWRGYHILSSHYIEGRQHQDVMQELSIGERQFYREQRRAIEALSQLLWEKHQWLDQHRDDGPADDLDILEEVELQTLQEEAGRLASRAERMELRDVMQGVLRAVGPLAREKGTSISYHFGEHVPAIYASRILTRQILIHVLSRCVIQQGISGIHAEFRRNRRQISAYVTALAPQGTRQSTTQALSLDTVKHLIEVAGGEWGGIDVEPTQYRLRFTLPTSEPEILLAIEDNPAAIRLLERYLAREDYRVVSAPNGEDALRMARELHPDVITLDLMMPQQDGWEVLQALKQDPVCGGIPVLICSVLDEPQVALALGANAYLKKPFSQAQLLDVLRGLCMDRRVVSEE